MSLHQPSLAHLLVRRLLAVFAGALVGSCILFLVLAWRHPTIEIHDDMGALADRLAARAALASDGSWTFAPDPALTAELARPHLGHVVLDVAADRVLAGSLASVADMIPEPPGTGPRRMAFAVDPGPGQAVKGIVGYVVERQGPRGPLRAAVVVRQESAWPFVDWALDELAEEVLPVGVPLAIVTLIVAAVTIRRTLRPITELSRQAEAITPRTTGLRLAERDVPREVVPLVRAFNAALARLDQGFLAQRRFTANAAHQLRTPLAILRARLDGMREDGDVRALKADCDRIARVVAQLLSIARLESDQIALAESVDLCRLAANVVAEMAPLAIAAGRSVALEAPPAPVVVRGNSAALEDALRNLVENGLRHGPAGQPVDVVVAPDASIAVRDRGPGVPAADRARVFEPFWRGAHAQAGGSGLGLAIVAEIAAAHGGKAAVRARDGGGAEFRIELPLGPFPAAAPRTEPAAATPSRAAVE
ncbi:MAG: HAMP domain-containing histidine kinase [Alphaproteobacteria bacterium]|nr:HAMP domain-containing histidine kinase [Alphaproteobacteria bacterium]